MFRCTLNVSWVFICCCHSPLAALFRWACVFSADLSFPGCWNSSSCCFLFIGFLGLSSDCWGTLSDGSSTSYASWNGLYSLWSSSGERNKLPVTCLGWGKVFHGLSSPTNSKPSIQLLVGFLRSPQKVHRSLMAAKLFRASTTSAPQARSLMSFW